MSDKTPLSLFERISLAILVGLATAMCGFGLLAALPDGLFKAGLNLFATAGRKTEIPLRLESITHEQAGDRFVLRIQVRNVSPEPISNLQAVVSVQGGGPEPKNTLLYPLDPPVLPPGQESVLQLGFPGDASILSYSVYFATPDGKTVPHRRR